MHNPGLTIKTSQIIEDKILEHPEDLEMRINKLTFLCLTSSDKVAEYFDSLSFYFKGDDIFIDLHSRYQQFVCSIFVPR